MPITNVAARASFLPRIVGFNRHVRLGRRGIDLDKVHVQDVDENGVDDLVTEHDGRIVWSSRGASGWRPIAPGGQDVRARLHQVALGDLTGDGAIDALVVNGRDWVLFASDGTRRTVRRDQGIRWIGADDVDGDGIRDVIVIYDDRSWAMARGGDVMGSLVALSSGSMGVNDIKLVRLQGTAGPVHAVGFVEGELSHVDLSTAPSGWQRVFRRPGLGPLPRHVSKVDDLWFVHVNRSAGPTERIDIVTWSDGRDGSGMPERAPAWVGDVLGSGAIGMQPFDFATNSMGDPSVGIDMKGQVAVGHFLNPLRATVITLGFITRSVPAQSDILGIGTRYGGWSATRLSDRYPLASTRELRTRYRATVDPEERVELEAAFMSAVRLGEVRVSVRRRGRSTRHLVSERRQLSGKTDSVHLVFQQELPGQYEVTIEPLRVTSVNDTAIWEITVRGDTCGDGFVDHDEVCDDGASNSDTVPDACRTNCRRARCGDGVVDSGEQCDEGARNNDVEADACRTNCQFSECGNGVLDPGEECDDGAANSDTTRDACRTDCRLPWCGDGVLDTGEPCEPVLHDNCLQCQLLR
jgi:hypothetical protein